MANRRLSVRRDQTRRKFVWARAGVFSTVAADTSTTLDMLQTFQTEYGAQLLGATVMRIRGRIRVDAAALASATVLIGIIVGDDGIVSPRPHDAPHADWMAFQPLIIGHAGDGTSGGGSQFADWEMDVKSSRKIEELGQTLHMVISNPLAGTAIDASGWFSVGLKLP